MEVRSAFAAEPGIEFAGKMQRRMLTFLVLGMVCSHALVPDEDAIQFPEESSSSLDDDSTSFIGSSSGSSSGVGSGVNGGGNAAAQSQSVQLNVGSNGGAGFSASASHSSSFNAQLPHPFGGSSLSASQAASQSASFSGNFGGNGGCGGGPGFSVSASQAASQASSHPGGSQASSQAAGFGASSTGIGGPCNQPFGPVARRPPSHTGFTPGNLWNTWTRYPTASFGSWAPPLPMQRRPPAFDAYGIVLRSRSRNTK